MRPPLPALPPDHRGGLLGKGVPSTTMDWVRNGIVLVTSIKNRRLGVGGWGRKGGGDTGGWAGARVGGRAGGRVLWGRVMGGLVARSDSRGLERG